MIEIILLTTVLSLLCCLWLLGRKDPSTKWDGVARGMLRSVETEKLADNDNISIQTSAGVVVCEFKVTPAFAAVPGRTTIDVSELKFAEDVAAATTLAINRATCGQLRAGSTEIPLVSIKNG